MADDLSPDFVCPEQKIRQRVTNFIFGKFRYLSDLLLSVRTAANCFPDAVCGREFSQHSSNATGRKRGLRVKRESRVIGTYHATLFNSGLFVFPQSLTAERYLLANAALAVEIQTIFASAADPELREW